MGSEMCIRDRLGVFGGVVTQEAIAEDDIAGVILPLVIPTANAGSVDRSPTTLAGHVEIQITYDGETFTTWMGTRKPGAWRVLAGASPYTIHRHDDEFRFVVNHPSAGHYNIDVARAQLTAGIAFRMTVAENKAKTTGTGEGQIEETHANITLNANNVQVAVALGGETSDWSITGALAR